MTFSKLFIEKFSPPVIIAEAGNNHEGNVDVGIKLIEEAQKAGADLVKFQAGTSEGFARRREDFQKYKKFELGKPGYEKLLDAGFKLGIPVFFSVWDDAFAEYRHMDYFKIAARQCNPEYIAKYDGPGTFISIPHTYPLEDLAALQIKDGIIMHCVTEYPAIDPYFSRMDDLRIHFPGKLLGYSDHTVGIEACLLSCLNYGAMFIEKHFTLDHNFGTLRDHRISANPNQMRVLVDTLKQKTGV